MNMHSAHTHDTANTKNHKNKMVKRTTLEFLIK